MKSLQKLDHPVVLMILLTLGVFAVANVLGMGFRALGWNGPASFFHM